MAKSQMFVVDHHPAIPPADLLKAWEDKWFDEEEHVDVLLIQAFQAGADQELEACCEWLVRDWTDVETADKLRAARRPKPPSLAEQAREIMLKDSENLWSEAEVDIIHRALERLQQLEEQP